MVCRCIKSSSALRRCSLFSTGSAGRRRGCDLSMSPGPTAKVRSAPLCCRVLGRAGYRVGLYTSPHLSSVRERFRINDRIISTRINLPQLASRIIAGPWATRQITYFEFTTALALLWFAESKVDLVILETGLGGRLDATNVVTPLVSVITSVSMDHEAYLGTIRRGLPGKRRGLSRPGCRCVAAGEAAGGSHGADPRRSRAAGSPLSSRP